MQLDVKLYLRPYADETYFFGQLPDAPARSACPKTWSMQTSGNSRCFKRVEDKSAIQYRRDYIDSFTCFGHVSTGPSRGSWGPGIIPSGVYFELHVFVISNHPILIFWQTFTNFMRALWNVHQPIVPDIHLKTLKPTERNAEGEFFEDYVPKKLTLSFSFNLLHSCSPGYMSETETQLKSRVLKPPSKPQCGSTFYPWAMSWWTKRQLAHWSRLSNWQRILQI